ncbi:hypothetical protein FRACYDRAFT_242303 [Fragilariopsis cylindrus CCMP1102]|uniref:Uncharacterized protein n=1 Tax=Fragilariopsis cylindrus CCMP1102 TaxID=635003 RepID=A0A1E7F723_9STRA|nr:hypothetical protein FRACYDRAFT_242303 [Fragilariopsis cylindrus CCMP1102]|eukprot:OEU13950.1 hypothetical protein FRACYDRAFT_242303 [Fragilariopsis cylindrus CCMP1102]
MIGVRYHCCRIESIVFVVLNIAATIYVVLICVLEVTSQSEDNTLDTGAMSEDPYRLLRFGQGLWNLSYILVILSVATVLGSLAKQDTVFVMGLPNSLAAAAMIILQLIEAALRILLLVFSKGTYDENPQKSSTKTIAPIIFGYTALMTAFFAHNLIISLLAEEHDGELGSKGGHDHDFTDESHHVDSDSSHGEGFAIGLNGGNVGTSKSICYGDENSNRHLTDDEEEIIESLEAKSSDLLSSFIDCEQVNDDIELGDTQKESQKVGDQSSSEQQIDDVVKWVSNFPPATQVVQAKESISGNSLSNEFPPTFNTFSDDFSRMASAATTSAAAAYSTTASVFTQNYTDDELDNCDGTDKETCIKPNIESSIEHLEEKVTDEKPVDLLEEIEVPLIEYSLYLENDVGSDNNITIEPSSGNSADLLEKCDVISVDIMPNNQNNKSRKRLASTISRATLRPRRKKISKRYRKKNVQLRKLVVPSAIKEGEERSSTSSSIYGESGIKEDVENDTENNESHGQTIYTNILITSGLEEVADDKNRTVVNMKQMEPIADIVLNVNETMSQTKDCDISFDQTTEARSIASEVKNFESYLTENAHSKLTSIPDKVTPISNAESNPESVDSSRSMEQKETIPSDGQRQNNAIQNLACKEEEDLTYTSFSNRGLALLNCFSQSYLAETSSSDEAYLSCFPAPQKPRHQQHRPDKSVRNSWNEPLPIPVLFCEEAPSFRIDVVSALTGDFDDDQSTSSSPNHDDDTLQPSDYSNKVKEDTETNSQRNAESEDDTPGKDDRKEDTDTDSHRGDDSGIVVGNSEGAMMGDKTVNSDGEKKYTDHDHDDDTMTEDKKGDIDDNDNENENDDEKNDADNGSETRQADQSSNTISELKNDSKADGGDHHGNSDLPCSSSAVVSMSRHGR